MFDVFINYVFNFVFITLCIGLFFTPFIVIFWWKHRKDIAQKRPHFNQFMERFFLSKESNYLVLCWAAGEAILWFVIPEFLLVLLIFMKIRRKFELVMYDLVGTVIGTIIAIYLHFSQETLLRVPYVYPQMIEKVREWFDQWGMLGVFFQPFSGVPYKIFNSLVLDYGFFIPLFIVLAVIARMLRYLLLYEIGKAIYPFVHKYVRKHYAILFFVMIAIFTALLMEVSLKYTY